MKAANRPPVGIAPEDKMIDDVIKYLAENLKVELVSSFQDCSNNQSITVRLKIGDTVISESSETIFVDVY